MEQASRAQVWTNRTLLGLFLACLALAYELARPFLSPLVLASFLVAVLHRPYEFLEAKLGGRKHVASALATLAVAVLLVLPAAVFLTMLARQLGGWVAQAKAWLGPGGMSRVFAGGELPPRLQHWVQTTLPVGQEQLASAIGKLAAALPAAAPGVFAVSVDLLIQGFVLVLALYYLFMDGKQLVLWFTDISPLKSGYTRELIQEFYRVAYAMLVGTAAVAVLQGLAAWLIFTVLGIQNALVWAMALAFASFVPAVGVGLVYIPMCAFLAGTGHGGKAVVLLVYSLAVIVLAIDHIVRPQLVKGKLTMHPLVVFIAIFGGVYFFGLIGLLLGPLVAAILITVLRIYSRDLSLRRGPPAPPTPAQEPRRTPALTPDKGPAGV
jgi:predicted PurR-regulated permease PerM